MKPPLSAGLAFLIAWHLEISEFPIILSGEQILMKGNWESSAIFAARAVFPLWGGPVSINTSGTLYYPSLVALEGFG